MKLTKIFARVIRFYLMFSLFVCNGWFWFAAIDLNLPVKIALLYLSAGVLGACASKIKVFGPVRRQMVAAACLAGLVLWTPAVLATYGFALLGLPLVLAYGPAALAGWTCAQRWSKRSGDPE
jgi:hypothetical protein